MTSTLSNQIIDKIAVLNLADYLAEIIELKKIKSTCNLDNQISTAIEKKWNQLYSKLTNVNASLRAPNNLKDWSWPQVLETQQPLLEKFGGHPCAAGFSVKRENLETLEKNITQIAEKNTKPEQFLPVSTVILVENTDNLNPQFIESVFLFDPFSQDFPLPIIKFRIQNFRSLEKKVFPSKKDNNLSHLKFKFNNISITYFNIKNSFAANILAFDSCQICAKPSINSFKGQTNFELIIETMNIS